MENELTLRDKLAMSIDTLPAISDVPAMEQVSKELGLTEWDDSSIADQMKWAFEYQAKMRYMYADAMLNERRK